MSNAELTHTEKLMLAEVTTALSQLVINKLKELKSEYGAGVMTPEDMAQSLDQLASNAHLLLDNFADRFRSVGKADIANSVEAWSDNYSIRAHNIQQKIDEGDTLGALQIGLGVVSKVGSSEHALEIVGSNFGEGGVNSLKNIGKLSSGLNNAITATQLCDAFSDGRMKDMAGIVINSLAASLAYGLASLLLGAAATPVVVVVAVAAVAGIVGNLASDAFDEFATMFGWEDPANASEIVRQALEVGNQAVLAHVGDNLFWGLDIGDDYVGLSGKRNDMVGAAGNDSLTGADKRDYLNGGADNDDLVGKGDVDKLYGGDGTDTLNGGAGDDMLKGGTGQDTYAFTTDDLAQAVSTDIIEDDDGNGSIVIDGIDVASMSLSEYVDGDSGVIAWQVYDYKYLFTYSDADQTLIITLRENGSRIVVHGWNNGGLGITLPELEETHPSQSEPLTTGDDLFGHNGNNTGDDKIVALTGNDGLSAGSGDDVIDAGDGKDLVYGSSGDDRLSGGAGDDLILDDSQVVDMEDWSDEAGSGGKTQRQRVMEKMQELGSAVVAKGKGWYVHATSDDSGTTTYVIVTANGIQMLDPDLSPSGDDVIDGGDGDDAIWSGEGSDVVVGDMGADAIDGGADDDVIKGGAGADQIWGDAPPSLVEDGDPSSFVSADADRNGNDAIYAGADNDVVAGVGGNDVIDGGDGADLLRGYGGPPGTVDDDDPDADYLKGGFGDDSLSGDAGNDTVIGGADDDLVIGDNVDADVRDGDDLLHGGTGNDSLHGSGADDLLFGGDGDDFIFGDSSQIDTDRHGDDVMYGGSGLDTLVGGGGNDTLLGGDDSDVLSGDNGESVVAIKYDGNDYLGGGDGEDTLTGWHGADTLSGGAMDDVLTSDEGDDVLHGDDGNDVMEGGAGKDVLDGGVDDDLMFGDSTQVDGANHSDDMLSGNAGNDTLVGGGANDFVLGGGGNDRLLGDNGTDQLDVAYHGNDRLLGGVGNDTLGGEGGNDTVHGGGGLDLIKGGGGADHLYGDGGGDTLFGFAGDDSLVGGAGNDELIGGFGSNTFTVAPGEGDDFIVAPPMSRPTGTALGGVLYLAGGLSPADVNIVKGGSSLKINYDGGSVVIQNYFNQYDFSSGGGTYYNFSPVTNIMFADGSHWLLADVKLALIQPTVGDDVIVGFDSAETIHGAGGDDSIEGMGGADVLSGNAGDDTLKGGLGSDQLFGGTGNDSLRGGQWADDLNGGAGSDTLYGNVGDDSLTGGTGDDYLNGGAGDDVYLFTSGDGHDTIRNNDDDQGHVDTLSFGEGISPMDVTAHRVGDDLLLQVAGTSDAITVQNYFHDDATGAWCLDAVTFSDGTTWDIKTVKQKVLTSTVGNDLLQGYASDDVISGGSGNDTLFGEAGDDQLFGNVGDDSLDSGDGADKLSGGSGNDQMHGDAGSDSLEGSAGMDTLQGGNASDVLIGGADGDQLRGGSGDDRYEFAQGDGNDTIVDMDGRSTLVLEGVVNDDIVMRRDGTTLVVHYSASAGDEVNFSNFFDATTGLALMALHIEGDAPWDLSKEDVDAQVMRGVSGDDVLFGNVMDNTIHAQGGRDTVHAAAGNDSVVGGAGDDTLHGDDGADSISGGIGKDELCGGLGMDSLYGGNGVDHLYGADGNDALHGGEGNDVLDGGAGADLMQGDAGDDTYLLNDADDSVTENIAGGTDTIQSTVTYTASVHIENIELAGTSAINATGNALNNQLTGNAESNQLTGMDGHDVLLGQDGADVLMAGAGNDMLDGGRDIDSMIGGIGDDTYRVDNVNDTISENAGEGLDVVKASSNYTLSGNVDKLVLVEGTSAYSGTGNDGDNVLVGNAHGNTLDGGAGADTLTGGAGVDIYVIDNANDVIVEQAGQGDDTVHSSVDYTLGGTLENLTLSGTANLEGTGNDKDNGLSGNAGNNRLAGGLGADTMVGGLGNDVYIAESSGDRVHESVDGGNDTVERHYDTNLVLANNVENLMLADGIQTGNGNKLGNTIIGNSEANTLGGLAGTDALHGLAGDDALFGGDGHDELSGNDGNDYLDGGVGIDTLTGGLGDDSYIVDNPDDAVIEQAGEGTDAVQAASSYVLSDHVENLFLMAGGGAIDGKGNALANYMAGNDADNVLYGQGGNDTMVAGKGYNSLAGGTGDDKYVIDTNSLGNVVDNSDGGFDGVFFSGGITRDDLSFARDGDDLLIFVNDAADPAVRVTDHFLGGDAEIDYVQPDGGYYLTTQEINQIVAANQSEGDYDQVVEGTNSGEQLTGSTGKDHVKGLDGDDQLFGMAGNDLLEGGGGADYLAGGDGSGTGSGDDQLKGGIGSDTLTGEDGANLLIGGADDDSYVYGGGQDTIDNTGGGNDGIFFNDGITVDDLSFTREGDDLVVTVSGDASKIVRVTNHFLGGDAAIDYIQPASGSLLDTAAISALVGTGNPGDGDNPPTDTGDDGDYSNVVDGTAAGEQLLGSSGRDLIHGLGGNDTVFGFGGDDKFEGGAGDDYISGGNGSFSGSGNDILVGEAGVDTLVGEDGSDTLIGGAGGDKYLWQTDSGFDLIDNTGGGTDWLFFNGVDPSRLAYHRDGDDLVIMVDDDPGQGVRVQDHFLGGDMAIDYVQPGSGYAIPASQIDGFLTPMPGAGVQMLASVEQPEIVANASNTWQIGGDFYERWRDASGGSSSLASRDTLADAHMGASIRVDASSTDGEPATELHRLIEAMAGFDPATAAVLDDLTVDAPGHPARVGALGAGMLQPRESTVHEYMS